MVFYNSMLLKIESSEYCGIGKCTAVRTAPKKYHDIPVFSHSSRINQTRYELIKPGTS